MKNNTLKIIIIFAIIILFAIIGYFIYNKTLLENKNNSHLKNYKSNEYIPTYVSSEDMAKIYLNDYLYYCRYDVEEAYKLLDKNYRNKKFNNIDEFKNYINIFANLNVKVNKYLISKKNGYRLYYIYDNNGNVFIFKTKGVMQYTVYLDEETVEIG